MKRIVSIILIVTLTVNVAACSSTSKQQSIQDRRQGVEKRAEWPPECKIEGCLDRANREMERGRLVKGIYMALYYQQMMAVKGRWNEVEEAECSMNKFIVFRSAALAFEVRARMVEELMEECNKGDRSACSSLGTLHYYFMEFGVARRSYKKACDLGSAQACLDLGVLHFRGLGVGIGMNAVQRAMRANELFNSACERGNMIGCYYVYKIFIHGYRKGKKEHVEECLARACRGNYLRACVREEGIERFKLGCDKGLCVACEMLAQEMAFRRKGKRKEETTEMQQHACDRGSFDSCIRIATGNIEKSKEYEKSKSLLEKACSFGRNWACLELRDLYRKGKGVARDAQKARQYWEKHQRHMRGVQMTVGREEAKED